MALSKYFCYYKLSGSLLGDRKRNHHEGFFILASLVLAVVAGGCSSVTSLVAGVATHPSGARTDIAPTAGFASVFLRVTEIVSFFVASVFSVCERAGAYRVLSRRGGRG